MANKKFSSAGIVSLITAILPMGLLVIGVMLLFKYIKKSGGLPALLGSLIGWQAPGTDQVVSTTQTALERIQAAIAKRKLVVTPIHTSIANSIFGIFNTTLSGGINLFSSTLNRTDQKNICKMYDSVEWTADQFLIFSEYGQRKANNRQNAFFGFIWDETTGDLRYHANRFMDGVEREKMLLAIDRALNAYSS